MRVAADGHGKAVEEDEDEEEDDDSGVGAPARQAKDVAPLVVATDAPWLERVAEHRVRWRRHSTEPGADMRSPLADRAYKRACKDAARRRQTIAADSRSAYSAPHPAALAAKLQRSTSAPAPSALA